MTFGACKIVKRDEAGTINPTFQDFQNELPAGVKHEINIIKRQTENDNKEKSLTMCELNGKLFVGNYAKGDEGSTEVLPCHKKYGKNARQIGDIHTHPFNSKDTIGLTPSEADFIGSLDTSFKSGTPQVSCIVGAGRKGLISKSNHVHCFQSTPQTVEDGDKVKKYNRAYNRYENIGNDVDPYFRENIGNDFVHIWYKDGKAIPKEQEAKDFDTIKEIVNESMGLSKKRLRLEDIKDIEKGSFCRLLQAYNLPDNETYFQICVNELAKRNIGGLIEY